MLNLPGLCAALEVALELDETPTATVTDEGVLFTLPAGADLDRLYPGPVPGDPPHTGYQIMSLVQDRADEYMATFGQNLN